MFKGENSDTRFFNTSFSPSLWLILRLARLLDLLYKLLDNAVQINDNFYLYKFWVAFSYDLATKVGIVATISRFHASNATAF